MLFVGFLLVAYSACFFCFSQLRNACPRLAPPTMAWPLNQSLFKKMSPQACPQASLMEGLISWSLNSLLSDDSSSCRVDKTLASMAAVYNYLLVHITQVTLYLIVYSYTHNIHKEEQIVLENKGNGGVFKSVDFYGKLIKRCDGKVAYSKIVGGSKQDC